MKILEEFAQKWARDPDNNFAVACYDQQSLDELYEAREAEPDQTDCDTWGLSHEEWREAIVAALIARTSISCAGCDRWLSPERDDPAPCENCECCQACCDCPMEPTDACTQAAIDAIHAEALAEGYTIYSEDDLGTTE